MASFSALKADVFGREQRRQHYGDTLLGLNAYERHKKFMQDYACYYGTAEAQRGLKLPIKTDHDTLRETYRFIRTEEDDSERTWEQRLAKRYHDKLFKEYCIADMSRYRESRIGLRWRTEKEVVSGKGQFECGNKECKATEGLRSYEVNFAYTEAGESKQALVKLRVCPKCAYKLNYRKEKELERKLRKESRQARKRKRKSREVSPQQSSESEEEDSSDSAKSWEEEPRFKKRAPEKEGPILNQWKKLKAKHLYQPWVPLDDNVHTCLPKPYQETFMGHKEAGFLMSPFYKYLTPSTDEAIFKCRKLGPSPF